VSLSEIYEILERLLLAILIGSIIGVNRDLQDKPAGLRTHALVALGSALITLVLVPLTPNIKPENLDAFSRVAQGIVSGIGFLGAGVILRVQNNKDVQGLTTAAGIWASAIFGMVCGIGAFAIALIGLGLTMLVLLLGGPVEQRIYQYFKSKQASEKSDK